MTGAQREVAKLEKTGVLHATDLPGAKDMLTSEKAAAQERETIALVETELDTGTIDVTVHRTMLFDLGPSMGAYWEWCRRYPETLVPARRAQRW